MKKLGLTAVWLAISGILALSGTIQAAPRFVYQDLGTLGWKGNASYAYRINNAGQVVGYSTNYAGITRAFLKNPGQPMEDLGTLVPNYSHAKSLAWCINNAGQVAGDSHFSSSSPNVHAFLKNPVQPMEDLGTLGGIESRAYGINDAGQVVGEAFTTRTIRAFLKNPGQPMQDLGTLGGTESLALGINNAGQVVGNSERSNANTRAFLKNPG